VSPLRFHTRRQPAVTILELLVVLLVTGILVALAFPAGGVVITKTQVTEARVDLRNIHQQAVAASLLQDRELTRAVYEELLVAEAQASEDTAWAAKYAYSNYDSDEPVRPQEPFELTLEITTLPDDLVFTLSTLTKRRRLVQVPFSLKNGFLTVVPGEGSSDTPGDDPGTEPEPEPEPEPLAPEDDPTNIEYLPPSADPEELAPDTWVPIDWMPVDTISTIHEPTPTSSVPAVLSQESVFSGLTSFPSTHANPPHRLYTTVSNGGVAVVTDTGTQTGASGQANWLLAPGTFQSPRGIVAGPSASNPGLLSYLYVVDAGSGANAGSVWRVNPHNGVREQLASGLNEPHSIAGFACISGTTRTDGQVCLWVATRSGVRVLNLTTGTQTTWMAGDFREIAVGSWGGARLVGLVTTSGAYTIYFTDQTVSRSLGGGVTNPWTGVATSPEGSLMVTGVGGGQPQSKLQVNFPVGGPAAYFLLQNLYDTTAAVSHFHGNAGVVYFAQSGCVVRADLVTFGQDSQRPLWCRSNLESAPATTVVASTVTPGSGYTTSRTSSWQWVDQGTIGGFTQYAPYSEWDTSVSPARARVWYSVGRTTTGVSASWQVACRDEAGAVVIPSGYSGTTTTSATTIRTTTGLLCPPAHPYPARFRVTNGSDATAFDQWSFDVPFGGTGYDLSALDANRLLVGHGRSVRVATRATNGSYTLSGAANVPSPLQNLLALDVCPGGNRALAIYSTATSGPIHAVMLTVSGTSVTAGTASAALNTTDGRDQAEAVCFGDRSVVVVRQVNPSSVNMTARAVALDTSVGQVPAVYGTTFERSHAGTQGAVELQGMVKVASDWVNISIGCRGGSFSCGSNSVSLRFDPSDGIVANSTVQVATGSVTQQGSLATISVPGDPDTYLLYRRAVGSTSGVTQSVVVRRFTGTTTASSFGSLNLGSVLGGMDVNDRNDGAVLELLPGRALVINRSQAGVLVGTVVDAAANMPRRVVTQSLGVSVPTGTGEQGTKAVAHGPQGGYAVITTTTSGGVQLTGGRWTGS
jgi:type II secretory pathway pseudopilin PulG